MTATLHGLRLPEEGLVRKPGSTHTSSTSSHHTARARPPPLNIGRAVFNSRNALLGPGKNGWLTDPVSGTPCRLPSTVRGNRRSGRQPTGVRCRRARVAGAPSQRSAASFGPAPASGREAAWSQPDEMPGQARPRFPASLLPSLPGRQRMPPCPEAWPAYALPTRSRQSFRSLETLFAQDFQQG